LAGSTTSDVAVIVALTLSVIVVSLAQVIFRWKIARRAG
jgi:hypothetical protein